MKGRRIKIPTGFLFIVAGAPKNKNPYEKFLFRFILMFDFNSVEKYLREGGNAETIAKAFADELNRAVAVVEDEQDLEDARGYLVEAWNGYMDAYFRHRKLPKGYAIEDFYFEDEQVEKMMERIVGMIPVVDKICDIGNKSNETLRSFYDKFGI